ncbi:unnamed protein product [Acanthoscelides obtectus]|uniref:Uncharacterized protein n=1 Tax=Acanthoscelides obtectus TaxID=200917 RepID=A0A9P0Q2F2_ACAOB|nr:unnamed protein product [Acanthoscelides obtectus]
MCEVRKENFGYMYPEIKKSIENAKFIAVDLEFSALYPVKGQTPSLFDEASERYMKIKKNLEHVIPVQVGLTTFSFNADSGSYLGTVYNFFIIPASFPTLQNVFCFQSGTLEFLRLHGFDFNKVSTVLLSQSV